jgi:hypothetical protein
MTNNFENNQDEINEGVVKFCRKKYAHKGFPSESDLAVLQNTAHNYPDAKIRNFSKQALQKIIAIEKTFQGEDAR